jgi:hypothetical protein
LDPFPGLAAAIKNGVWVGLERKNWAEKPSVISGFCAGFFGVCGELWLISGFNACFTWI